MPREPRDCAVDGFPRHAHLSIGRRRRGRRNRCRGRTTAFLSSLRRLAYGPITYVTTYVPGTRTATESHGLSVCRRILPTTESSGLSVCSHWNACFAGDRPGIDHRTGVFVYTTTCNSFGVLDPFPSTIRPRLVRSETTLCLFPLCTFAVFFLSFRFPFHRSIPAFGFRPPVENASTRGRRRAPPPSLVALARTCVLSIFICVSVVLPKCIPNNSYRISSRTSPLASFARSTMCVFNLIIFFSYHLPSIAVVVFRNCTRQSPSLALFRLPPTDAQCFL